jgi:radical SAM superfamily enzyme YgiQ (UPF0313 family)
VGEGEEIILEIIKRVESGSNHFEDLNGLAFWKKEVPVLNPGINIIKDLEVLPFPMRPPRALDVGGDIFSLRSPVASVLTSRGCPHQCTFCTSHVVHGRNFRKRSTKSVVDEIEFLVNQCGIREINILDDSFSEDKRHAISICEEIIKRDLDISWRAIVGLRADTLDREVLKAFKDSGCYKIAMGIESFSADVLGRSKKPLLRKGLHGTIGLIKSFQIATMGYFIIGLPGETEDSVLETIRFARESELDYPYFSKAIPLPGTDLFKQVYREFDVSKIDWSDFGTFSGQAFSLSRISSKKIKMYYAFAFASSYLKWRRIKRLFLDMTRSKHKGFSKLIRFIFRSLCHVV